MKDKSILVVDDNLKNVQVLGSILKEQGFRLLIATSGEAALSVLKQKEVDLVLLDVMMPGIDGYETCRRIRSEYGLSQLPVIFITARTDKKDIVMGFDSGGMDYISKPFQQAELLARINTHLELFRVRKELAESNSQLSQANEKLTLASLTDPLTNLWNRRYMIKRIEDEISRSHRSGKSFSLVMADIDFFKSINDNYGHLAGDHILVEFSSVLNRVCRQHDIVSRWGGEEFLILLPETEGKGAAVLAEKLREDVEAFSMNYDKKRLRITASFGVAESFEEETIDQIINKSDIALYQSKKQGRNRVTCLRIPSSEISEA